MFIIVLWNTIFSVLSEPNTRKRKKAREPIDSNVAVPEDSTEVPQLETSYLKIDTAQPTVVDEMFENKKGKKKARTTFTGKYSYSLIVGMEIPEK